MAAPSCICNKRGDVMDLIEYSKQIGKNVQTRENIVTANTISKSPFDQTYIGRVVDKEINNSSTINNGYITRWIVVANGRMFRVNADSSNITAVGQKVRIYLPNNDKNSVYAETINPATAPDKIVYIENDSQYDSFKEYGVNTSKEIEIEDVTIDSITETWQLADKSTLKRLFILTVINAGESDEEVTNIICPDGKKINLEGFVIGG